MNIQSLRSRLAEEYPQVQDIITGKHNGVYIVLTNCDERYLREGRNAEETYLNALCAITDTFTYASYPKINNHSSITFMLDFLTSHRFQFTEVRYKDDNRDDNLILGVGVRAYCDTIVHEFEHTISRKKRYQILIEFMHKVLEWEKHNSFAEVCVKQYF